MAKPISFLGIISDKKNLKFLIIAAAGVLLLIISLFMGGGDRSAKSTDISLGEYKLRLEEELSGICSSVEGAGKCRVMITFSEGGAA
jgi:hypothetical protein